MIKGFSAIKSVGRFRAYTAPKGNQYDFDNFTIIFGRNTKGKSTLTAILRSAKDNDPSVLVGRKTFGSVTDQEVFINFEAVDGTPSIIKFQKKLWDVKLEDVFIFDSKYVKENVHLDGQIGEDHQKNLEAIILGEKGMKLLKDVQDTHDACQVNSNRKQEITRQFNIHQKQPTSLEFEKFRKLIIDNDVQEKIDTKKIEIETYTKYIDIKTKLGTIKTSLEDIDFEAYKTSLKPTLEVKQDSIKQHIKDNLKNTQDATRFLYEGFKQIKDDGACCVFCGQSIRDGDAHDLIENYSVLFSEAYRELSKAVREAGDYTKSFSVKKFIENDIARLGDLGIEINTSKETEDIETACTILSDAIVKKSQDLNYVIEEQLIINVIDSIVTLKAAFETKLKDYAEEFDEKKLEKLVGEQKDLTSIKIRSEAPWLELCNEYSDLITEYKLLEANREKALQSKTKYASAICTEYEVFINKNLKALNADFKLKNIKTRDKVRTKDPLYNIEFFDTHTINVLSSNPEEPCFDNTLSESDRRLLAFAFYLAEAEQHPNKEKLILVLDDPMSSFDENRKIRTINLLKDVRTKVRQTILLTHENGFLRMLTGRIGSHRTFKLEFDKSNATSTIELLDVNEEYLDQHFENLKSLDSLKDAKDSDVTPDKLRCMRDMIEHIQTRKYYLIIKDEINSNGSVSAFTNRLLADGVYTSTVAQSITDLYSNFWNHDDSDKSLKKDNFSPDDLRSIASKFFEVMKDI
jgi:wobble nucleotide-excising tRNase